MALVPVQEKLASERQPSAQDIDEFYYGHRLQVVYDAAGNEDYVYIPLTQDDFLDPQEGDYFVEGTLHERDVEKVKDMFRHLHRGLRDWDDDIAYTVFGYRMVRGRYAEIRPDARGWLFSDVNQAWIGVNPERDGFLLVDARTGQRVLPDLGRAEIAEERAEIAEERAKAVEQVAYLEAEARAAAERRIRELEAELSRLTADK